MKKFGLIGKSLKHSFSKQYFEEKFRELNLNDFSYDLIEKENLEGINIFLIENNYSGVNVTIPYKEKIIPFLDEISDEAKQIGAINTIKNENEKLIGYNTDYFGFQESLLKFIPHNKIKALVFGTGGASKAIIQVLEDLFIHHKIVSRQNGYDFNYQTLPSKVLADYKLLINTTPLGTFPNVEDCINIDFNQISDSHFLFDLIYNPEKTLFLQKGKTRGAKVKNGLEMLQLQAEKSWQIWNS